MSIVQGPLNSFFSRWPNAVLHPLNHTDTYMIVFGAWQHPTKGMLPSTVTFYDVFKEKLGDKVTILFEGFAGNYWPVHHYDAQYDGTRQRIVIFELNGDV